MIPYGKQFIDQNDINLVIETLKSSFLTTGPKIEEFEEKFARYTGAKYAVAVSNGTAALHIACLAAGLKQGEELITTPMTFVASANCALYCGAKPVFADINENGLIDPGQIQKKISVNTKIILPVHYAGKVCDMENIKKIAEKNNLIVIEDACHALGAEYKDSKIGDCKYSDMVVFSFHPVKHITTGEGGMITTNSKKTYDVLKLLRSHGITKEQDKLVNKEEGPWNQEMQILGFNYRITDFQCSLGITQLDKLNEFIEERKKIARKYDEMLKNLGIPKTFENGFENDKDCQKDNVYHLYLIKCKSLKEKSRLFEYLKQNEILCQVHYMPVYWHPYYLKNGYKKGECPKAEEFYKRIISIPIYPGLTEKEQEFIIRKIKEFYDSEMGGND